MFWNLPFRSHFWFDDLFIQSVLWHLLFFLQVYVPPVLSLISLNFFHGFPFDPRPSSVTCLSHFPSSAYRDVPAPADYCCQYLAPSAGGPNSVCPKWINLGPEKVIQMPLPILQVLLPVFSSHMMLVERWKRTALALPHCRKTTALKQSEVEHILFILTCSLVISSQLLLPLGYYHSRFS